jgi:hypothetical protein
MDQIRALDDQRAKLLEGAKSEALDLANKAIQGLNALGFNYRLVETGRRSGGERKGTRQIKDGPCPVCGFKTIPPHDGRAHRAQKSKKAFTATELSARGYEKV